MTKTDSFSKGKVRASVAGKTVRFRDTAKKCDIAARLKECGLDVAMLEAQNDKRSA